MSEQQSIAEPSKSKAAIERARHLDRIFSDSSHIGSDSAADSTKKLCQCRELRTKYVYKRLVEPWEVQPTINTSVEYSIGLNDWGIFEVYGEANHGSETDQTVKKPNLFPVPSVSEFIEDHKIIEKIVQSKVVKTLSGHRLNTLEHLFEIHFLFYNFYILLETI